MNSTKTHTLEIKGMSGEACVNRVTTALKGVDGVTTQSVKVGSATITCDDQAKSGAAVTAINAAGYKAWEAPASTAGPAAEAPSDAAPTPATPLKARQRVSNQTAKSSEDMAGEGAGASIDDTGDEDDEGARPAVAVPAKGDGAVVASHGPAAG